LDTINQLSLDNMQGYRYELWCLARASGVRYCVVGACSLIYVLRTMAWLA
jgi:hypothetical protein